MSLRIYLVQPDNETTTSRLARLHSKGFTVFTESKDGQDAYQHIRTLTPDLVVFDLATNPSHSLQVAEALRKCSSLQHLPFLFVDGDTRSIYGAQQRINNAHFTSSDNLITDINSLSAKLMYCLA